MNYLSLKKVQTIALSLAFIALVPQTVQAQSLAAGIPVMVTMTTTPGGANTVMANLEPATPALKSEFPEAAQRPARRTLTVVATAYSSEPGQTDNTPCIPAMSSFDLCANFAKTGVEDTIAANDLSLGTKVRFPELFGDKVFTVRDRMNSKYTGKSRIDFWMNEKSDAIKFGAQRIKMEVL